MNLIIVKMDAGKSQREVCYDSRGKIPQDRIDEITGEMEQIGAQLSIQEGYIECEGAVRTVTYLGTQGWYSVNDEVISGGEKSNLLRTFKLMDDGGLLEFVV